MARASATRADRRRSLVQAHARYRACTITTRWPGRASSSGRPGMSEQSKVPPTRRGPRERRRATTGRPSWARCRRRQARRRASRSARRLRARSSSSTTHTGERVSAGDQSPYDARNASRRGALASIRAPLFRRWSTALPSTTRADLDPGEEHFVVHSPLEWVAAIRTSRYLREYPVDVPWDEPELVDAIVAQVMANFRSA